MRWYASLRRSGEIAHVRRRGRQAGVETLTAFALPPGDRSSRVAVTVATAVGCAVVRNRVKRRIKSALDARAVPATAVRLVVVARPAAATQPYSRLVSDLATSLDRLGVLP